mgnify:FL=1|tara:strand:+ start:57 stop:632 length:576 start_codon:yes stop_codon:yes gene_type:complete
MIIDRIFPTTIMIFDDVLEEECIKSMGNDILSFKGYNTKWQNTYEPEALSNKALELSKKYIDELKYEYEDLYITDMWSNILRIGETHRPHTHSNNLVSGIFYIQCNDDSPAINFIDPRPQTTVLQPQQKEYTKENSTTWQVPAKINRMVLFPSWLQHYVPKNNSYDRISVSFNVMLRGQVGRSENFQSNRF